MNEQVNNTFELNLPVDLADRLQKNNVEYLMFLRDVSRRDPCAAATLGLSTEMVEMFSQSELRKLLDIASTPVAMCKLRFNNTKFWQDALAGNVDSNDIAHMLLKEAA